LIGAAGGGYLAQYLSWRTAFVLMGAPGILLGLALWLRLRDPPRGLSDGLAHSAAQTPTLLEVARHLGRRPTFWQLVIAIGLTNIAINGLGSFLPQYFARVSHLALGEVGVVYGAIGAGATLASYVFGGAIADWISRRDSRWYAWLSALGCLASVPLYILSFLVSGAVSSTLLLTFASIAVFLYYTPTQVVLQNMAQPRMRATVAFVFFLVVGVVGVGAGPALVGGISDALASHAFPDGDYRLQCLAAPGPHIPAVAQACSVASSLGLQRALIVVACVGLWAAVHFVLAARTLRADLGPAST
jgi:predicted MFS family arabinose efflux permease